KEEKPIDWARYTRAQTSEMSDYLLLVRALVDESERSLPKERPGRGRPAKPAADLAKAILLQQYFQVGNRTAEGLAELFREKLGIRSKLTYSDIARAYDDPRVLFLMRAVFDRTIEPIRASEQALSIDGTGLPTSVKRNYESDKGTEHAKQYDMLIGMIGVRSKLFTAFEITGAGSECPFLGPLLEESAQKLDCIELVTADAAYLSRPNCNAIARIGAIPRIFPKRNTVLLRRGSQAWKDMLEALVEDAQQWLREYHQRSISESGNSVLKRRYPRPLLKRCDPKRRAEGCYRVVSYNVRMLAYGFRLRGLNVPCLRQAG
ncbi:MAG TPA: transposase, partial [archaeon]|nr:transposase [archaeon]